MRLEACNISKRYGNTVALRGVPLSLEPGRVHALVGENGAGKSTLLKICAGVERQSRGEVLLDDEPFNPGSAHEARADGVALVFQELTVSQTLTVAENIFIDRLAEFKNAFGLVSTRRLNEVAAGLLQRLDLDIDPGTVAGSLDFGQMKCVEVCRALSVNPSIVLMDESTAFLNYTEVRAVLAVIARLRNEGIAVAFVSHHLNEVFEVADELTVLKDGAHVGTYLRDEVTQDQLHAAMVGRELADDLYPSCLPQPVAAKPLLSMQNVRLQKESPPLDLTLQAGEILGIAGLKGAGGEFLLEALAGDRKLFSGTIALEGKDITLSSPCNAWANGIAFLPGDRTGQGLITSFSIVENISMSVRPCIGPFFDFARADQLAREAITTLTIKADGPRITVDSLSGGNMQKVLLGKCLASTPNILLLNNPTRGVDLGARQEIYRVLVKLIEQGIGILLVSEDLPELLGLSHRIATFRRGQLEAVLANDASLTETDLVSRMI